MEKKKPKLIKFTESPNTPIYLNPYKIEAIREKEGKIIVLTGNNEYILEVDQEEKDIFFDNYFIQSLKGNQ